MTIVSANVIMDGASVFKLVDTHGLPLDIIVMELRDRGMGFNAPQFIDAARNAGWKDNRILNMMLTTCNDPKGVERIKHYIRTHTKGPRQ